MSACQPSNEENNLPEDFLEIQSYVKENVVIAHRGTTHWAPEETEAAYRWARNSGAHYLELDLQRTKELRDESGKIIEPSVLLALHDDNLLRTTDILDKFPEDSHKHVSELTWSEVSQLDAGSWFNSAKPKRARKSFEGLELLTLEDVAMISLGYKLKRDDNGRRVMALLEENGKLVWKFEYEKDLEDNGNRPGLYIETKVPKFFPGIEEDLSKELSRLGWNIETSETLLEIGDNAGKVSVANEQGRVVLQTFSRESLKLLNKYMPGLPKCLLLYEEPENINDGSDREEYLDWINFGIANGAQFMGPSIGGEPNNYTDLLHDWQAKLIHEHGMKTHAYSFDTEEQFLEYTGVTKKQAGLDLNTHKLINGAFTNDAVITMTLYNKHFIEKSENQLMNDQQNILNKLGY
ncbi:glycerophosphodiester phosphodiesterase family protein [Aureibacter tunicatorum]|uniref:Glycerophosphoryl diester phosphodiesterase n=1 Tax=Aureibacter tunicatorum TaxID=866807 RepID=A0AAE3XIG9_9BACT|nr:glycerophosphodiester phosphodiesterase family protein [Aureibacter tunicatorum]MDR6238341.1 glycerophosphoryl diester phosphodiesterase [Aureibacter tunicatorum]